MSEYNAYEQLLSRAEEGSMSDQCDLAGMLWWGGNSFPRDLEQSRYWYGEAAQKGCKESQYNYGIMLLEGHGGSADSTMGLKYVEMSAEGDDGYYSAAMELADLYGSGRFAVDIDLDKVVYWELQTQRFRLRDLQSLKMESF